MFNLVLSSIKTFSTRVLGGFAQASKWVFRVILISLCGLVATGFVVCFAHYTKSLVDGIYTLL